MREGNRQAKDELVQHYRPLARSTAAALYAGRHINELEFDDFLHYALVGLLEAMDRYDPEKGASFSTYASYRIRGAVLNGVEKLTEKQQQILARQRILAERASTLKEHRQNPKGMDELFTSLADIAIGLALGCMLEGSGLFRSSEDEVEPDTAYTRYELKQTGERIVALVDALPENERLIIKLHYLHGVKFENIALEMNLSKGRISQLHNKGLTHLRALYEQEHGIDKRF